MDAAGPQVCDDMTVEVALSVMASARTGRLRVCDNDGLCTGLVTRAHLTVVRDGPGYSDRLQLRDVLGDRGPRPAPAAMAAKDPTYRRLSTHFAADERDNAPGALAPAL
ncbi:CBS domain-containing protein [Streptomyces sp. NPDC019224]|uniref:CBS domain-containing protein n=1 Tax=Streptomyces sp. NPDC019224 TaxID=3154484 RepID=UPI00340CF25C